MNLAKCGVYRYAEEPDFEILLFGYSINGGEVTVIDLANGEKIPTDIMTALTDESVIKEDFETVSVLVQQRANQRGIAQGVGEYQKRYVFSSKIICGECNNTFKRRTHTSKNGDYIAWCCTTHLENKDDCFILK